MNCPILGVFGEADDIISIDDVVRFRNALEKAQKDCHIRLYPEAPHGCLNDTMPGRYLREAAKDAWSLMLAFLKKCFADGRDGEQIVCRYEAAYSKSYDFAKNVRLE